MQLLRSLALLGILVAAVLAGPTAPDPYQNCASIGWGSGCSGCNNPNTGCEWCTSPVMEPLGTCMPTGKCGTREDWLDNPFVANPGICPEDINRERIMRDSIGKWRDVSEYISQGYDSHYCDFPHEPWIVDRTVSDEDCFRVNNLNAVGQLGSIKRCLFERGIKRAATAEGEVIEEGEVSKKKEIELTLKQKECIRLTQSFLCTSYCPKYGEAFNKDYFSSEYCERYNQHCDDADLNNCILQTGNWNWDCAEPDAPFSFSPDLIDVTGKFEGDLCFYGDSSRCHAEDCQVAVAPTSQQWPGQAINYNSDDVHHPGANFSASQTGPACCDSNYYNGETVGFLLKVVKLGTPSGLSCEVAALDALRAYTGGAAFGDSFDTLCRPDISGFCFGVATYMGDAPSGPPGCTPKSTDSTVMWTNNCPGIFDWWFD